MAKPPAEQVAVCRLGVTGTRSTRVAPGRADDPGGVPTCELPCSATPATRRSTSSTTSRSTDPGPGEVTIKIEATGVCHSDLSAMTGVIPQPAPAVLGHEGAGIISAVGEGVTSVKEGDHVIVAWSPPCGQCVNCTARHSPHLCTEIMMSKSLRPALHAGRHRRSSAWPAPAPSPSTRRCPSRARSRSTTTSPSRSPR